MFGRYARRWSTHDGITIEGLVLLTALSIIHTVVAIFLVLR